MDSKSYFMGGLSLKARPKIVTKNDCKSTNNRQNKSFDSKSSQKSSNLSTLNNSLITNYQQNSILSGNSLNQNLSLKEQNQPIFKNTKVQFIKHTENQKRPTQKSISLLQKSPTKMQSLLQKRTILNTMNSNLIANQYNSSNLLINSLMKTTNNLSPISLNQYQQEKAATTQNSDKMDDKMIKVIKLCVTKLEFSSPLFRRIATKMSFLYIKPCYEHIRNYERFCSTSNKSVLKQVTNKGHTLKYKPPGNRSRMLRSNEIVDGKIMISWHRSSYVHVYTFNKRQRLRRYRQISMDLGFEHRSLKIMYGLKKVTLPKIIDCPCCKKMVTPDLGHYCVVSRKTSTINRRLKLRSSSAIKSSSLLKKAHKQIKLNANRTQQQTSEYVSNESGYSSDLSGANKFKIRSRDKNSLLEDCSKINLNKLSSPVDDERSSKRCPTLLLDSSNIYKTDASTDVIVRRMNNKELNKKLNSNLERNKESSNESLNRLQIKKIDSKMSPRSLIKCRVIDQHNFTVSTSLENNIKIVFK